MLISSQYPLSEKLNYTQDIAAHRKLSYLDTFSLIFNNSFKIFLTTETGWVRVDTYHVFPTIDEDISILNLGITLDMSFPAIIGNNPEVITEHFSTKQPMIKILLTGEKSAYAYSFFQYLELDAIEIDVQVEKMKQLNLFTEVGEIDDSLPFQFFGPTPRLGSFLLVGNDEVFKKQLTDLSFDIVWNNLPKTRNGFKDYYKGYPAEFENSDFEVSLTVLKDFEFYPPAEDQVIRFPLFASTQGENRTTPLVPFSSIDDVPVETLRLTPDYDLSTELVYDNLTKTGFFKLELCNPPLGFGEDVFVDTYAAAVQNNAFLESKYGKGGGKKKDEMVVVPKLPFVPIARSLTMGYSASTKIDYTTVNLKDKETEVYHIHPFGRERIFHHGKVYNDAPLPKFEYDGYLYIGLKDLIPPQILTLYFELADSVKANTAQKAPKVTWSYLSENVWYNFQESQLLHDGTVGFSTSGIIRIDIPHHISPDNTIMPNKLHWLRVAVEGDVELLSTTYNIYTQAVSATWQPDEKDVHHFDTPLPAGSVERTQEDIAAIVKVNQPYPSFGGIASESAAQFYTRVSERLRHKDRAVTCWDFERLVLDKFPSVQQVKCFANFTHPKYVKPGEVIVLIIPKTNEYNMMPRANIKMLNEVKEYLDNISSPFVRIIVRNPLYEQVSVICDIRFDKGKNNGLYIELLNKELNTFLSPHTGGKERHTKLSGKISKETILNFIEQRPYVDFITKNSVIQLITEEDGDKLLVDTANKALPTTTIFTNYPWSVLVPVKHHRLKLLPADDYTYKSPETTAIGKMAVGVDFVIQNREAEKKIAEHEQKRSVVANPQKSLKKKNTLEKRKEKDTSGERKVYSLEWNINLNK